MIDGEPATECGICLDSIFARKWGAVASCGHAYHVSCFEALVSHNKSKESVGGGSWWKGKGSSNPSCPMCGKEAEGFHQVFVDLGRTEGDAPTSESEGASASGGDAGDDEEKGGATVVQASTPPSNGRMQLGWRRSVEAGRRCIEVTEETADIVVLPVLLAIVLSGIGVSVWIVYC